MREFSYSPDAYKEHVLRIETLNQDYAKNEMALKRHCAAAFSDTLVAWMHLKVRFPLLTDVVLLPMVRVWFHFLSIRDSPCR